jgi:acetaldehyde dehydrogenase/alcohol dehydrogenase
MLKPINLDMISDDQRQKAEQYLELFEFNENEFVYRAGDKADRGYLVDEGEVRLEIATDELDSERVLEIVPPDVFFGEHALLGVTEHKVNAIASTYVRGRSLSEQAMERMQREDPELAAVVYRALGTSTAAKLRLAVAAVSEQRYMTYGHTAEVDEMVARARKSQEAFVGWSEKHVDELLFAMCEPIITNAVELAEDAVAETHMGNVRDKTLKHINAALGVYEHIVGKQGAGAMRSRASRDVIEVADAMGVLFGLIPATNPVSTTCFKALISINYPESKPHW